MNLAKVVFDLAETFMNDSKYVKVNYDAIDEFVEKEQDSEPPKFPPQLRKGDTFKICLLELLGDAINYCYWYGRSTIRPLEAGSTKMYSILDAAFEKFDKNGGVYSFDNCLDKAIRFYSLERFPLLEERIKHLNELRPNVQKFIANVMKQEYDVDKYLVDMVQIFPGFASDMFLKRAFLFFSQLNRMFGWFEDDMKDLPVPADYQVPKILEHFNLIKYDDELKYCIENEIHIQKHSTPECEIRAATIIACRDIAQKLNWTMPQVDGYFWLKRKEVTTPFHLTVTSDY